MAAGASSRDLDLAVEAAIAAAQAQASRIVGPRSHSLLRLGRGVVLPLQANLRQLAAPWACAISLPEQGDPAASAPPAAQARAALVLRAQTATDRTALAQLARRWRAQRRPIDPAPPGALWALREARLGRATGPCLTPQNNRADWAVAIVGDTLVATWGARMMDCTLAALEAPAAPAPPLGDALDALGLAPGGSPPPGTIAVGLGHLDVLAARAEALLLAGAGEALGGSPLRAMPQLLMMGPTGDLLREVEALHDVAVTLSCAAPGALRLHVHERLAVP